MNALLKLRRTERGWRWRARLNAIGAINGHDRLIEDALTLDRSDTALPRRAAPRVLVLVARLDRASLGALAYARSIAPLVTAVHVTDDPREGERMRRRWRALQVDGDTDLVILESPCRALIQPLLAYIDALQAQDPERPITIVLSELVPRWPWEYLLHNQTALRLKLRFFLRPNTVVIDVPYHIERLREARGEVIRECTNRDDATEPVTRREPCGPRSRTRWARRR